MRLDKLLANSGYGSRSVIKKMISSGSVTVNGITVTDPKTDVTEADDITINGSQAGLTRYLYFVLDKPDEVITAMEDQRHKCVGDFIPAELKGKHLSPVGRLDYHTTGLLVITNDGELNHALTSPKYRITKTYKVTYEGGALTQEHIDEAAEGIILRDMDKPVHLAPSELIIQGDNTCLITLTEGKTHEVRRIISHWGRQVVTLRRIRLGTLELISEEPGNIRMLTEKEIQSLKAML